MSHARTHENRARDYGWSRSGASHGESFNPFLCRGGVDRTGAAPHARRSLPSMTWGLMCTAWHAVACHDQCTACTPVACHDQCLSPPVPVPCHHDCVMLSPPCHQDCAILSPPFHHESLRRKGRAPGTGSRAQYHHRHSGHRSKRATSQALYKSIPRRPCPIPVPPCTGPSRRRRRQNRRLSVAVFARTAALQQPSLPRFCATRRKYPAEQPSLQATGLSSTLSG